MPFWRRPDGVRVKDLTPIQTIEPFVMPTRNESVAYLDFPVDLTNLRAYLKEKNAGRSMEQRLAVFPTLLAAMARTMALRPRMNRFVVGHRIYQRNEIVFSFAVKKKMADEATMTMVKMPFEPTDTLATVHERMQRYVSSGRSEKSTSSEREMRFVSKLPRFLLRFVIALFRKLDYFNLAPASMIKADELYATMVLANLGSVGLDAAFHHLYEWGTASIFCVIGRVQKMPVYDARGQSEIRDIVPLKITLDERISDGYYNARSLELFRRYIENPAELENPPASLEEVRM